MQTEKEEGAPLTGGPVDRSVRERIGFCPVCMVDRPSIPAPAEGICAHCYNHLMKPCSDCSSYMHQDVVDPVCFGQDGHRYSALYARRHDDLCGAEGKWAVIPNGEVSGVPHHETNKER